MRIMSRTLLAVTAAGGLLGCPCHGSGPFLLTVVPEGITDSIPEQRCVFLVTVEENPEEGSLDGPVHITVSASGADVLLENADILPGDVAEVTVLPLPLGEASELQATKKDRDVTASIAAEHNGAQITQRVNVHVTSEEEDLVGPLAAPIRDLFVPWLAENQPELGITEETEWAGTIVTPHILVVTHYLYFSEAWEIHVYWHVMIPPHDWARIELRRRYTETVPSLAFQLPSVSEEPPLGVVAITPSDTLWR